MRGDIDKNNVLVVKVQLINPRRRAPPWLKSRGPRVKIKYAVTGACWGDRKFATFLIKLFKSFLYQESGEWIFSDIP